MKKSSFENPLLPDVRMRALYRALVETRVLSEGLPASAAIRRGLEACWVSAAIDLRPGDFALDSQGGTLFAHTQRLGARAGTQMPTRSAFKTTLQAPGLAFAGSAAERLLCAAGAAMAAKANQRGQAVLAFTGHDETNASAWFNVMRLAAAEGLPLLLFALPAPKPRGRGRMAPHRNLERIAGRVSPRTDARMSHPAVPVIPVDAGDAIALYRVVQESLVRVRAGSGAVVIDCIDCGVDPIAMLGTQVVERGVATLRWVKAIEPAIRRLLE